MRRLALAFLLILLSASTGWAAITFVEAGTMAGGSTTTVYTFSTTADADLIVFLVRVNNLTDTVTMSSVPSNTFTAGTIGQIGGGDRYFPFYVKNIVTTSGAVAVTATTASGVFIRGVGAAYRGLHATSPLDQSTSINTGSGTAVSTSGVTTTCANEVVVMMAANLEGTSYTAGSGYTARATTETDLVILDKIVSAAGSNTGTATAGASVTWGAFLMTFADVAAPCASASSGVRRRVIQ